jgi:sugar lactone lactonase YvrE
LVEVTVGATPTVNNLAAVEAGINGVTLGEDGAVYYSDQTGGNIYRVTSTGTKTKVTTTTISDPNGIAFGADKQLYVLTFGVGASGMDVPWHRAN